MSSVVALKGWAKKRETPLARAIYDIADAVRRPAVPVFKPLHGSLYRLHVAISSGLHWFLQSFWYSPLFQSRLNQPAAGLLLSNGMPQILGPLMIDLGRDCKVNGAATWTGRAAAPMTPVFSVGSNVTLGWRNVISVGTRVEIGDNTLLSSDVHIAGYPGHPLDAGDRAAGLPEPDEMCGDVIIEDDVWIGAGVFVGKGVRIGRGTVVAARSVVTRDIPPFTLAAGAPAKPVRSLSAGSECAAREDVL